MNETKGLNKENTPVNLLWTGGWDSTFRLIELSREPVTVQPVYLYGDGRKSVSYEFAAMERILELLWNHPETKAEILPPQKVEIGSIPQNPAITQAYKNIIKTHKLGSQYEWIARYAAMNPGLEIGVEKPHENGIGYMQKVIASEGGLSATGDVHRYKVVPQSEDVKQILANVYFPIMETTEKDMLRLVDEWGYQDVMKHIWFCHAPIQGKPCGVCRPCCEKVESEMDFLLDEKAMKRNRIFKTLGQGKIAKVYAKVVKLANKG